MNPRLVSMVLFVSAVAHVACGADSLPAADSPPVRSAAALPLEHRTTLNGDSVDDVYCDRRFRPNGSAHWERDYYGEVSYPGRSIDDLARVVVLRCDSVSGKPTGYECHRVGDDVFVRDGAVAVTCIEPGDRYRMILPPPPTAPAAAPR